MISSHHSVRLRHGLIFAAPLDGVDCQDVGPARLTPTVTGSLTTVDGPFGPAVSFDGASYATYPASEVLKLGIRAEWSFAAWFNATNTAASRYIIQVGSTSSFVLYILHLTSTAVRIGQAGSGSDITTTNTTVVNEWWHVAMRGYSQKVDSIITRGSDGRRIVDTLSQTAQAGYTSSAADGQGVIIGANRVTSVSNQWLGALARVALWNRALTNRELSACATWAMN